MSNINQKITSQIVLKYSITGFMFGLFFPVLAWSFFILSGKYSFSINDIKLMHLDYPLNFIIDLAPLVMAIASFLFAGKVSKVHLHLLGFLFH